MTIQIVIFWSPSVQLGLNNYASKHDLREMAAQHKMKIRIKGQIFIINFILLAENEYYWVYYLFNRMLKSLIDGTETKQVNVNWEYQLTDWLLILGSMEHWISIVWGKLNEMMCNLKCMKYKHYPNIEIHNSKV